jgi:hypothetical protein
MLIFKRQPGRSYQEGGWQLRAPLVLRVDPDYILTKVCARSSSNYLSSFLLIIKVSFLLWYVRGCNSLSIIMSSYYFHFL